MTHAIEESWHRRLAHINYKALPYICKAVTGLPELIGDHEGVCNGCAQGKNIKNPFPKRDSKAEVIKIFLCAYGQKQQWQLFMCITDYPIAHLGSRHRKRCSSERSQR
jgi:hypothetical protein